MFFQFEKKIVKSKNRSKNKNQHLIRFRARQVHTKDKRLDKQFASFTKLKIFSRFYLSCQL